MSVRLDRLLSNLGYCTRKEAGKLVRSGTVTDLAGNPYKKAADKVDPEQVLLDGEPLDPPTLILMMNKPSGYTCSHRDRPPLIFELLPDRYNFRDPKLSCVGRLDKDTTGLIMMTKRWPAFAPAHFAQLEGAEGLQVETSLEVTDEQVRRLAEGGWCLPDDDKPLAPAECRATGERSLELTLIEGRYHQVKRMLEAVGNPLTSLHRSQFAHWNLGELKPGEWRHFAPEEQATLFESCGLQTVQ